MWLFLLLEGPFVAVLITKALLFWSLCWGPSFLEAPI